MATCPQLCPPVRMWPPLPTVTPVIALRAQPGGPGRSQLGSCCLPASADSSQTWSHSQMLGTSTGTDLFSGPTQPTTASVGSPLAGLDPNPATPAAGAWDPGSRPHRHWSWTPVQGALPSTSHRGGLSTAPSLVISLAGTGKEGFPTSLCCKDASSMERWISSPLWLVIGLTVESKGPES